MVTKQLDMTAQDAADETEYYETDFLLEYITYKYSTILIFILCEVANLLTLETPNFYSFTIFRSFLVYSNTL